MQNVYTVRQVNAYIKSMFTQDVVLRSIYMKGEVSNCKYHTSGHIYFSLKDESGTISCVMFASARKGLAFGMKNGQQVLVLGNISVYERDGTYQLYASRILLDGAGLLYEKFEALKAELEEMGMFDPVYKKPIPPFVKKLGVVTAPTGAAVRDIIQISRRRNPGIQIILYPALVQGEGAAESVAKGIAMLDAYGVDVIIAGRGGGSIEDLWAFNEEIVAQAIFDCSVPIISAVGHETDTTLVDYVSDARAPTPTAAAELITPDLEEVRMNVSLMRRRLVKDMETRLHMAKQALEPIRSHRYMRDPLSYIREEEMKLAMHVQQLSIVEAAVAAMAMQLKQNSHKLAIHSERLFQKNTRSIAESRLRLTQALHNYDTLRKRQIGNISALLDAYSPLKSLSRGYAIAYHGDEVISSVDDVEQNDRLRLRMQDGYLYTNIEKKEKL